MSLDLYSTQVRATLHQLPTPEYVQAEQRAYDTLNRIVSGLSGDMKEFEMLHGWCEVQVTKLQHDANRIIDITTRNQLLGAAQAYGIVDQALGHRISRMGNSIEELREVCEL